MGESKPAQAGRPGGEAQPQRPFTPAPEIQALLEQIKVIGNDLDDLSREKLATARALREQGAQRVLWHIPLECTRNFCVPGGKDPVPVRLYIPHDKQLARRGKLPVVVFFHGGGWTLGSPSIYDPVTRQLARQIPALVLSVDYRLAPENPFPAAVEDANAVVRWVRSSAEEFGGDPARLVLAGDSAGGNLAIISALHARTSQGPPLFMQVLFYPSTNISSTDYESYRQYGQDHLLTHQAVERFREFYLPSRSDWAKPDASPLLAQDLQGLPPTLIVAAGCDPLRDEGQAFAAKLREHAVEVRYHLEPQLIHAFLNFFGVFPDCSPYAEAALGYAAGVIRARCLNLV